MASSSSSSKKLAAMSKKDWKLLTSFFFIGFFDHNLQLAGVELLAHCVQNGCHSVRLDEASFALIEHGKGLLQHLSFLIIGVHDEDVVGKAVVLVTTVEVLRRCVNDCPM